MKINVFISFLFLIGFSVKAQQSFAFDKRVDSINTILSQNKLRYFTGDKTGTVNSKMIRIMVQKSGRVIILGSLKNDGEIPKDYCYKQLVYFNLFEIAGWDIYTGYAYLRGKDKNSIGRIFGISNEDLYKLKTQFDSLRMLCATYAEDREKKEQAVKDGAIKKRDDLPNPKNNANRVATEKALKEALQKN